jgi:lipoprotein NlpD
MALVLRFAVVAAAVTLGACAPSLQNYEGDYHIVQSGETLYTISWRRGIDYRDLARWNALDDPNLIFVGQRLRLRPPPQSARTSASGEPRQANVPASAAAPARPLPTPVVLPAPEWLWPTPGSVVAPFGSRDGIGTGISIAGTRGQTIRAAAGGRVVYVGTGLAGYGQLVIIKHNDTYLSAYGYTDGVRVDQGQEVVSGQAIALMGLGPRRQPRLHFEIRRNGNPVDPLSMVRPSAG